MILFTMAVLAIAIITYSIIGNTVQCYKHPQTEQEDSFYHSIGYKVIITCPDNITSEIIGFGVS